MSGNFRKKLLDEKLPFFVLLFSFFLSLFFLALHSFHPSATIFLEQLNNLVLVSPDMWQRMLHYGKKVNIRNICKQIHTFLK